MAERAFFKLRVKPGGEQEYVDLREEDVAWRFKPAAAVAATQTGGKGGLAVEEEGVEDLITEALT